MVSTGCGTTLSSVISRISVLSQEAKASIIPAPIMIIFFLI